MHHDVLDRRALALDRLVAAKLRADPALLDRARSTLARWLPVVSPRSRPALLEWQARLDGPLEDILALLESDAEQARRLRQSSPFCGILTRGERTRVLLEFNRREPHAA